MGICFAAHRFDPRAVEEVTRRAAEKPDLSGKEARRFLESFGLDTPAKFEMDSWEEVEESLDFDTWNQVLKYAASRNSWELDKSLTSSSSNLLNVTKVVPSLMPVWQMLQEAMSGSGLPDHLAPNDAAGIFGIAKSETVQLAFEAASKFSGPGSRERIADIRLGLGKGLLRGNAALKAWREDDYLWNYWIELVDAMRETAEARHWFALEMY